MVSENTASWKMALPDTEGRRIFLRAESMPNVCGSVLEDSLGLIAKASIEMPKRTKKNATGSSR